MVPSTFDPQKPNAAQLQDILDEALTLDLKSATFRVLYAIARLSQQNPGLPVTVLQIAMKSGIGETTTKAAVKELRKALLIDTTEHQAGTIFEFLPAAPNPVSEVKPQVSRGSLFDGSSSTSIDLVVEEEISSEVDASLQQALGEKKDSPGNSAHWCTGRRGVFSLEISDLVDHFEALVTPHLKQRVTVTKRVAWYESVVHLAITRKRPVEEIHAVFAWLFTTWRGYLPFPVKWGDRKITRVRQISMNYDRIVAVMGEAA